MRMAAQLERSSAEADRGRVQRHAGSDVCSGACEHLAGMLRYATHGAGDSFPAGRSVFDA
jgi:hypothetical protein